MKRLLCAWLAAATAPLWAQAPAAAKPIRALMVTGGCCHDFTEQKRILSEGISARANVVWTIVHEGIPSPANDGRDVRVSLYATPGWWQGYDVVVHNECFGMVADNAFIEGITAAHQAGVPAVMLHCSAMSYRAGTTDEWRKLMGVTSRSHEKRRTLLVRRREGQHPVMKSFPAEWEDADDELYKVEKAWPKMVPLAEAYGEETKANHPVIWLNEYGPAKVFATTLGHQNATMSSPVYLDLVTRGLLWACGKLRPDGEPAAGCGAERR